MNVAVSRVCIRFMLLLIPLFSVAFKGLIRFGLLTNSGPEMHITTAVVFRRCAISDLLLRVLNLLLCFRICHRDLHFKATVLMEGLENIEKRKLCIYSKYSSKFTVC